MLLLSFLGTAILVYGLMAIIVFIVCWAMYKIFVSSLIVSKISFSLLLAFMIQGSRLPFVTNETVNYWLWVLIFLVSLFLLSMLPKANEGLKFFCTFFIAFLVTFMLDGIFLTKYHDVLWQAILIETSIKILCIGISLYYVYREVSIQGQQSSSNKIANIAGRCLAAVCYGIPLMSLFYSPYGNWEFADFVYVLIFLACIGIAYIGEPILLGDNTN